MKATIFRAVMLGLLIGVCIDAVLYTIYWRYYRTEKIHGETAEEISGYAFGFRQLCRTTSVPADVRCTTPVDFYWRESRRPPKWLWRSDIITPYEAAAPFYFIPWTRQIIVIDLKYWEEKYSEDRRRELIWHEMGHALMRWHHSDSRHSLMRVSGYSGDPMVGFLEAWKENEE